mmetsp:Transcript_4936/g.15009  ORF Transcript_4936/g.15009 Transcript_4936/m.15009 type:complete len:214 (-) Transcript_4936:71-712(-)
MHAAAAMPQWLWRRRRRPRQVQQMGVRRRRASQSQWRRSMITSQGWRGASHVCCSTRDAAAHVRHGLLQHTRCGSACAHALLQHTRCSSACAACTAARSPVFCVEELFGASLVRFAGVAVWVEAWRKKAGAEARRKQRRCWRMAHGAASVVQRPELEPVLQALCMEQCHRRCMWISACCSLTWQVKHEYVFLATSRCLLRVAHACLHGSAPSL